MRWSLRIPHWICATVHGLVITFSNNNLSSQWVITSTTSSGVKRICQKPYICKIGLSIQTIYCYNWDLQRVLCIILDNGIGYSLCPIVPSQILLIPLLSAICNILWSPAPLTLTFLWYLCCQKEISKIGSKSSEDSLTAWEILKNDDLNRIHTCISCVNNFTYD